ncbi:MAG: MIP/aquaporin family protein [Flavobacteriales bacterium]
MKKFVAEFLGAFLLVLIGTGSIILNNFFFDIGQLGIGIAFCLAVILSILLFSNTSGAHINPAVSLAFWFNQQLSTYYFFLYCIAQIMGAIFASLLLKWCFNPINMGETIPSGHWLESFVLELLLTFIMMLVILFTSNSKFFSNYSSQLIGITVGLEAYLAGPICGASMNPARSIGPALLSYNFSFLWIYIVAPCLGALFAIVLHNFINASSNRRTSRA